MYILCLSRRCWKPLKNKFRIVQIQTIFKVTCYPFTPIELAKQLREPVKILVKPFGPHPLTGQSDARCTIRQYVPASLKKNLPFVIVYCSVNAMLCNICLLHRCSSKSGSMLKNKLFWMSEIMHFVLFTTIYTFVATWKIFYSPLPLGYLLSVVFPTNGPKGSEWPSDACCSWIYLRSFVRSSPVTEAQRLQNTEAEGFHAVVDMVLRRVIGKSYTGII